MRTSDDILRCNICLTGYFIGNKHECPLPNTIDQIMEDEFLGFGYMSFCGECETIILKDNQYKSNLCEMCRERLKFERKNKKAPK